MSSRTMDVARAVASSLNTTPYDWPSVVPGTGPRLLTALTTAEAYLEEQDDRDSKRIEDWTASIYPKTDGRLFQDDVEDGCSWRWFYMYYMVVKKRLPPNTDPATNQQRTTTPEDREEAIEFAESFTYFFDANRTPHEPVANRAISIVRVNHPVLWNKDELINSHVFESMIDVNVRFI